MTHISIKATTMFTLEVTRAALEHPLITAKYPSGKIWRHTDVHFNDIAAEITLVRSGENFKIDVHCEVEYDGGIRRGFGDVTINGDVWEFTGWVSDGALSVRLTEVSR